MSQRTILFDFDDVLFPVLPTWISILNKEYGMALSPTDIADKHIAEFLPDLTVEQILAPVLSDGFWESLKPPRYAVESIYNLICRKCKVKAIISSEYYNFEAKVNALLRYYPFFTCQDVHVTLDRQSVRGYALVSDDPCGLVGGKFKKLLIDQPYNRDFGDVEGIHRMRDVQEACDVLCDWIEGEYDDFPILSDEECDQINAAYRTEGVSE